MLRLYRAVLLAYPKTFRDECAEEMISTLRSRAMDVQQRGGSRWWFRFWARELYAILRSGIRMRVASSSSYRSAKLPRGFFHGDGSMFLSILQDVKYAVRSFRKTPALTSILVVTLALGIGANAAVLPFIYGILVRPLPFDEPDRLATLFENAPGFTRASPSYPNYADWRDRSTAFQGMAAYSRVSRTLTGNGDPQRLDGCRVSFSLFDLLRVRPAIGRVFLPEDDVPGAQPAIMLSHRLWTQRFATDSAVTEQSLSLDGVLHTIVGVLPAGFHFPNQADYWIPLRMSPTAGRTSSIGSVIGRLTSSATFETAQVEMSAIAAQLALDYPETNAQRGVVVRPLADDLLWGRKRPVLIFYAVACIVLLLACANVANLLLARSTERRREIAMRAVLGASRMRIARQLLTESLLLAAFGGALGLLIGNWGRDVSVAAMSNPLPYYFQFDMGIPVLLAILGTTLLSGILFSILPTMGTELSALSEGLHAGDSRQQGGRKTSRIRSALVVSEIGLALVVLVGAGLLTRSFFSLTAVEAGFDQENLLTVRVALPRDRYSEASQQLEFFRVARERLQAVAGVVGVSGVSNLPMTGSHQRSSIYAEHSPVPVPGEEDFSLGRQILPEFFEVMGIPLLRGRTFADVDVVSDGRQLVIVDQALASHLWPDESPLGKRIKYGAADNTRWPWMEVIGVVGNTHHFSLDDDSEKGMYRPFSQEPLRVQTVVIRTAGDPTLLADQIRREIWTIDSNLPLDDIRPMDAIVRDSYWERSAQMWLLSALSAIAIALATFGVYGVVAYSVSQRTREFGIRMALGAERLEVARLVARQVGLLAFVGLACGVVVALVVTRFGSALLFEVGYTDPLTYGIAVAGMAVIIILAGYVPARRAANLDPAAALRSE